MYVRPKNFDEACERIAEVFGKRKGVDKEKALKGLRKNIEKLLGQRDNWDAYLLRALFDVLIEYKDKRRRSAEHERLWLNLTGFCMRPGWGDAADPWRIEKLWPLYEEFLSFEKDTQSWVELWTFWRRAAGGLNAEQQRHIFEGVAPYVDPQYLESRKVQAEAQKISYDDILRLLAALERVPVKYKVQLIEHLFTRIQLNKSSPMAYWAIGRIATRNLLHAGSELVIPAEQVRAWLHNLLHDGALAHDWDDKQVAFCAAMMVCQTGDRYSDIGGEYRTQVIERLRQVRAPQAWVDMVESQTKLDSQVAESIYGDALPAGLKLL